MSKWSPEQIAMLKKIREDNPEFAQTIDELRKQFPGSKIVYLKSGDFEVGERTDPEKCVAPCIDYEALARAKETAEKGTRIAKPQTVAEKRRAMTRYKE